MAESGMPGFEITTWYGLMAPAQTPSPHIRRLSADTIKVVNEPEIKAFFFAQGLDVVGNLPGEFAALIKNDIAKFAKVVKASGAKFE
jgi:tripartite-type tricarboxylate transporter receptor subunit TctC